MAAISIKQLLEAGVHFGHQTARWNPKMKPFIFGERNAIHIIDLQKTLKLFQEAVHFLTNVAAQGKTVLFVGTKSQAQETIEEEARRCGMFWVTNRWLGGLLTNFATVQNSIKRYRELETMRDNGFYEKLSKKEVARLERERKKHEKNLRGIRDLEKCPDVVFLVDPNQESIAVKEAAKLKIPIIAVVDTNCDPDLIDYVIPGNDDALRAVKLFTGTVADAIVAGRSIHLARVEAAEKEAQEKAAKEEARRKAAKEAKEAAQKAAQKAAEKVAAEAANATVEVKADSEGAVEKVGERSAQAAGKADTGEQASKVDSVATTAVANTLGDAGDAPVTKKTATKKTATKKAAKKTATKKTATKKTAKKATAAKKTKASGKAATSTATKKAKKATKVQTASSADKEGAEGQAVKVEQEAPTAVSVGSSKDNDTSDADS